MPEGDALEQAADVVKTPTDDDHPEEERALTYPRHIPQDADPADVMEQDQTVDDEDDDRR